MRFRFRETRAVGVAKRSDRYGLLISIILKRSDRDNNGLSEQFVAEEALPGRNCSQKLPGEQGWLRSGSEFLKLPDERSRNNGPSSGEQSRTTQPFRGICQLLERFLARAIKHFGPLP